MTINPIETETRLSPTEGVSINPYGGGRTRS